MTNTLLREGAAHDPESLGTPKSPEDLDVSIDIGGRHGMSNEKKSRRRRVGPKRIVQHNYHDHGLEQPAEEKLAEDNTLVNKTFPVVDPPDCKDCDNILRAEAALRSWPALEGPKCEGVKRKEGAEGKEEATISRDNNRPTPNRRWRRHPRGPRGGVTKPFPLKLHVMLERAKHESEDGIVGWQPHGRAFMVRNSAMFIDKVMTRHFHQSKMTSFQRQLNLYEFSRLTVGKDRGAYYHELFLRGKPSLCIKMVRVRTKGTGCKGASNPNEEPDFYSMPPIDPDWWQPVSSPPLQCRQFHMESGYSVDKCRSSIAEPRSKASNNEIHQERESCIEEYKDPSSKREVEQKEWHPTPSVQNKIDGLSRVTQKALRVDALVAKTTHILKELASCQNGASLAMGDQGTNTFQEGARNAPSTPKYGPLTRPESINSFTSEIHQISSGSSEWGTKTPLQCANVVPHSPDSNPCPPPIDVQSFTTILHTDTANRPPTPPIRSLAAAIDPTPLTPSTPITHHLPCRGDSVQFVHDECKAHQIRKKPQEEFSSPSNPPENQQDYWSFQRHENGGLTNFCSRTTPSLTVAPTSVPATHQDCGGHDNSTTHEDKGQKIKMDSQWGSNISKYPQSLLTEGEGLAPPHPEINQEVPMAKRCRKAPPAVSPITDQGDPPDHSLCASTMRSRLHGPHFSDQDQGWKKDESDIVLFEGNSFHFIDPLGFSCPLPLSSSVRQPLLSLRGRGELLSPDVVTSHWSRGGGLGGSMLTPDSSKSPFLSSFKKYETSLYSPPLTTTRKRAVHLNSHIDTSQLPSIEEFGSKECYFGIKQRLFKPMPPSSDKRLANKENSRGVNTNRVEREEKGIESSPTSQLRGLSPAYSNKQEDGCGGDDLSVFCSGINEDVIPSDFFNYIGLSLEQDEHALSVHMFPNIDDDTVA